jgi:succinyl-CoA synthetase alpha subunit
VGILIDENTRVLVQGITGREGRTHTEAMLSYGTRIVAGVSPGKGGSAVFGIKVYDSVEEAVKEHPEINTSIVFVPAQAALDACYEAIDAGIKLIVVITEGIPIHETLKLIRYARLSGSRIVGPNCPGLITPSKCKVSIMPSNLFSPGPVGIVSRSGTLTYEVAMNLTRAGMGQSTAIGIGGDPVVGTSLIEVLEMFRQDKDTLNVVIIGEIGGDAEERAAQYLTQVKYGKPVVAYVAGRTAPPGKRMGHAGAIISMGTGDAESKIKALMDAGVKVAQTPSQIVELLLDSVQASR